MEGHNYKILTESINNTLEIAMVRLTNIIQEQRKSATCARECRLLGSGKAGCSLSHPYAVRSPGQRGPSAPALDVPQDFATRGSSVVREAILG